MSRFLRNTNVQTIEFERNYHFTTSDIDSLYTILNQTYRYRNELTDTDVTIFDDETSIEYQISTLLGDSEPYLIFLLLHNVSVINFVMLCEWFDEGGKGYGYLSTDTLLDYILRYDTVHRQHRKNQIYAIIKQTPLQLTENDEKQVLLTLIYDKFEEDNNVDILDDGLYFTPVINHIIDNTTSFRNYRTGIVEYRKIVGELSSDMEFTSLAADYVDEIYTDLQYTDPLIVLPITRDSMFNNTNHSNFYKRCLMGIRQNLSDFLITLDLLVDYLVLNNVTDEDIIDNFYNYLNNFKPNIINSEEELDKLLFISFFDNDNSYIDGIYDDVNKIRQWLLSIRDKLKTDKRYTQIIKEGELL